MVEKGLGAGLVVAVALWCGLIAAEPAVAVKPPDCAVICLKTEPITWPPIIVIEFIEEPVEQPVQIHEVYP